MSMKRRWALNPRKWFGSISHAAYRREKSSQLVDYVIPLPPPVVKPTRPIIHTALVPRILTSRSKTKITPVLSTNDNNNYYITSANTSRPFAQLQVASYNIGREKTMGPLNHANTFASIVRKTGRSKEEIPISALQKSIVIISCNPSKLLKSSSSSYGNIVQKNSLEKQPEMNTSNLSDRDLLDCPRDSSNDFTNNHLLLRRSRSSSSLSIDDNDTRDESSSSGVFTDERADSDDRNRKASKDTLSTFEVLSVESIADSPTSFNHEPSRPLSHRYRLPLLSMETIDDKPTRLSNEPSIIHSYRAYSAENILKDNPLVAPAIGSNRRSSAAIIKKIEKRTLPGQPPPPPILLEKPAFVRVSNDTYRLTTEKDDRLYRRQRQNSAIHYSHHEDSLPPADDEEYYATLPQTSSTDQLQNDLRAVVDDYLRPVAASMNKNLAPSTKTQQRSKRSQTHNEQAEINIDDITDRLLSSIACSTYAQYQRCY